MVDYLLFDMLVMSVDKSFGNLIYVGENNVKISNKWSEIMAILELN